MKYILYFYILLIVFIFFLYGLILSEFIDFIFPDQDDNLPQYRIVLEIIGEIGIAYLIYFLFKKYSEKIIDKIFNILKGKPPSYMHQLLLIAFSTGIYKHLEKSGHKMVFMRKKILNF